MKFTTFFMDSEWMKALGWTFVHSIWQIAIIGLVLYIVLRCVPGRSAHTRYTIASMALWLIVVSSLSTFILMLPQREEVTTLAGKVIMVSASSTLSVAQRFSHWLELRMPMMLTIWMGGVAILMLRLLLSLGWVQHIRYDSFPEEQLQEALHQIISRLRLKVKAVTSESHYLKSPVTIGHLKPMILFPVGIVNQLTPKEVEAILTHELAHIVRRDYLSNLVQSVIETLFYYHPVTWWISNMVRTERENRADDLAVSWCGDHLGYAKALMAVQEMQLRQTPSLTVGFASGKKAMLMRIQRVLNLPYKNHNQMEKTVLLSLCSLCFLAFTLSSHTPDNTQARNNEPVSLLKVVRNQEQSVDTIPARGIYKIHKKTDDQDISIEVENGDIKSLMVDGKTIEPSAYREFEPVIDQLFGIVAPAPLSVPGLAMPATPLMPAMPEGLDFHFAMPPMPDLPDMPALELRELERLMEGHMLQGIGDHDPIAVWNGKGLNHFKMMTDSTGDGNTRIIIIEGNDTSVLCTPHMTWSFAAPGMDVQGILPDKEARKELEQQLRNQWREQEEQWRKQQQEWREQNRQNMNQYRGQQDRLREEKQRLRETERQWNPAPPEPPFMEEDLRRKIEEEARMADDLAHYRVFGIPSPNLSLSEQMVEDGLIEPGAEVKVQLTPDKLKIDGHKMSDALHAKYLRIYERQQGVELSGNSRVEFTTKTRQRM